MLKKVMTSEHAILELFDQKNISYRLIDHPKARDAVEISRLRKTPLEIGVKSLMFKDKCGEYFIFSLRAHTQCDSQRVRKILKSSKLRFASPEELFKLTGLEKGQLPPIGKPLCPFSLFIEENIYQYDTLAFTLGRSDRSIELKIKDFLSVVHHRIESFEKSSIVD